MPLDYETDSKLKALAPVIDEHAEWFCRAVKRVFYPGHFKDQEPLAVPERFQKWHSEASDYDFIGKVTLADLKKLYEELHMVAKGLTDKARFDEEIPIQEFDDFTSLYESFIFKLRRLEHDCALADSGMDIESGLRSKQAMEVDINRELERRARRGNPFTLALARIDNYDALKDKVDAEQMQQVIGTVGKLIKKCIRSFDDAYRSGEDEFIMSLKHSEAVGGTAAVNRLRSFLADENMVIKVDGEELRLTMSYCVAEPVPGDTQADLLNNMRKDLEIWREDGDTSVEYHEQSPLQRFLREGD